MGPFHTYSSLGGLTAGFDNAVSAPYASVSGGLSNTASGPVASVSGGSHNTASGIAASVSGGSDNTASGAFASVSGGFARSAPAENNWVAGSLFEAFGGSRRGVMPAAAPRFGTNGGTPWLSSGYDCGGASGCWWLGGCW